MFGGDDDDHYDEFGNYTGPAMNEDVYDMGAATAAVGWGVDDDADVDGGAAHDDGGALMDLSLDGPAQTAAAAGAVVLHEDKQYYPDAEEVYPGVKVAVMDEDTQPLEKPILDPVRVKSFSTLEKTAPRTTYATDFLLGLAKIPSRTRAVAVVGHLHHGKSSVCDLLVKETHWYKAEQREWPLTGPDALPRYTDARHDEQERGLGIKSTPMSVVLAETRGKSNLVQFIDCPGHPCFFDETVAATRAVDGVVVVVDSIEGCVMGTDRAIRQAVADGCAITLVINKLDRLILELKLPPADAYFKLVNVIAEVNTCIAKHWKVYGAADAKPPRVSPAKGNVCFASAQHGWLFSLGSFAAMHCGQQAEAGVDPAKFAARLWGDIWLDPESRTFVRGKAPPRTGDEPVHRSFIAFVLEPLYKIYSQCLGEATADLKRTLSALGVRLKKQEAEMDPKPLLTLVFGKLFGDLTGFADMVARHVPSPAESQASRGKVDRGYGGALGTACVAAMRASDPNGPLMMHVTKLYSTPDGEDFLSFGRIYSGTLKLGDSVKVLGDAYSLEDDEDMQTCVVSSLSVGQSRYRLEVNEATPGMLVMLGGVDAIVAKTATITSAGAADEVEVFKPLAIPGIATMKLAVEPLQPNELPKMTGALRKISKSYPSARTKVEESGEHVLLGVGELHLDCMMHDLRHMYSDMEVKVADPSVSFCETVVETSSLKCFCETANKHNKLTVIAEPLEAGLAEKLDGGFVPVGASKKVLGEYFTSNYDWDLLAARSVWAFGPEASGPNVLIDDTLPSEVDKSLVAKARPSIVQGFQWGCREGPLCDEPIRACKFRVLDAVLAAQGIHRGGGQLIPTARRVCYSAFLMATPRLMEPIFSVEVHCPADVVAAVYPVMANRRGHIVKDAPKPGSPFYVANGFIPAMDSFGFETDLRQYTQGQAMCFQEFSHWAVVPGDPLDRSIVLHPLEPSPPPLLAREFVVKTRRRKGLCEDVSVTKYLDDAALVELSRQESLA